MPLKKMSPVHHKIPRSHLTSFTKFLISFYSLKAYTMSLRIVFCPRIVGHPRVPVWWRTKSCNASTRWCWTRWVAAYVLLRCPLRARENRVAVESNKRHFTRISFLLNQDLTRLFVVVWLHYQCLDLITIKPSVKVVWMKTRRTCPLGMEFRAYRD